MKILGWGCSVCLGKSEEAIVAGAESRDGWDKHIQEQDHIGSEDDLEL